jgi:hypothetical protein
MIEILGGVSCPAASLNGPRSPYAPAVISITVRSMVTMGVHKVRKVYNDKKIEAKPMRVNAGILLESL